MSRNRYINPTAILALALLLIVAIMILPVPPLVLDFGLSASFSLAILIFVITVFIDKPLDFSSFPTILLASLMLRLSLNVSSTKLIIGEGHTGIQAAGGVIQGFATFIMAGNAFLGLIIFLVLLIVNFMVITKGATRMAEVAARFSLDAMPGRQLAIDSDVAAGAITHQEAAIRREREQHETTFFGSLDGASKFVKGDAVAGLLITMLNIVAGLIMGIFVHDMSLGSAFQSYAVLTVGDGLVSQIPAVIISIASALLLARAGNTGATDVAIFQQIGRHPTALYCGALLTFLFALAPGLPVVPFLTGSILLGAFGYYCSKEMPQKANNPEEVAQEAVSSKETIGDLLELDDIHIEFSPTLLNIMLSPESGIDARIVNMRRHVAQTYGLILPEVRLSDQIDLAKDRYSIRIFGVERAAGIVETGKMMALLSNESEPHNGLQKVKEPVYGAPAVWVKTDDQEKYAMQGATIISPEEVIATHLLETIRGNLSQLMTIQNLQRTLLEFKNVSNENRAGSNTRLIEETIPDKVPLDVLQAVFKLLLDERISIRNIPLILEAISEARLHSANIDTICENVRKRLKHQITANLLQSDSSAPLIQLDQEWEDVFLKYQVGDAAGSNNVALPPEVFNELTHKISSKLEECHKTGSFPALVTTSIRRKFLSTILRAKGVSATVVAFDEIDTEANPKLMGVVGR